MRQNNRWERGLTLLYALVPLLGMLAALLTAWQRIATWRDVAIMVGMNFFTGIGITVGYHRMLVHRSFEAHPAVRFSLLALGSMAAQNDPLRFASIHIQHHALADVEGDPHSPIDGLFHAHFGWILDGFTIQPQTYGTWLLKDRMVLFFHRTFWGWVALGLVIPYLLGGWTGLLWGGLARMFWSHHVTWSVNSICHAFGRRPFATGDRSTNQWLVGLLALGEGWHNNHHAFPRSAMHGLRPWQIDLSGYLILLMERLGLVWNVWRIPETVLAERLARSSIASVVVE